MLERFTERAHRAAHEAQEAARRRRLNCIGDECLLAGLLLESQDQPVEKRNLAARFLYSLGVSLEAVGEQIDQLTLASPQAIVGQIPFNPDGKKVLELALREALSLGHNYIDTVHILLGIIRNVDGCGAQILRALIPDYDRQTLRQAVVDKLYEEQRVRS
jgi:ATP-dependent Clp protease ATP-binding subunit ClpC